MLVDQQHGNVFPLLGEVLERFLDSRRFGLGVDDEEIPLCVWAVCDVLRTLLVVVFREDSMSAW